MSLEDHVLGFAEQIRSGEIEIYNEFSLQHELGLYLRNVLRGQKVRFERNVSSFFHDSSGFAKREIDIAVLDSDDSPCHAIELKYPRNGQHPEQMYSFCKDLVFAEELVEAGFSSASVLIFAEDPLFYSGKCEGIYGYFRGERPISGAIQKPTGARDTVLKVKGQYVASWSDVVGPLKYALLSVVGLDCDTDGPLD